MTWRPGQPVDSAEDVAAWQTWRKMRKLELQRERRGQCRRIDYYPSQAAMERIRKAMLDSHVFNRPISSVIDGLITDESKLPESNSEKFRNNSSERC